MLISVPKVLDEADATTLISAHLDAARSQAKKDHTVPELIDPAGYDTGLSAEEVLWTRRGWAGRT